MLQRVVDHADGWLPNRIAPEQMAEARQELDRLAKKAGRDPASITITVYGQPQDINIVQPLLDAGASRAVIKLEHVETEAEMLAQMEQVAAKMLGR